MVRANSKNQKEVEENLQNEELEKWKEKFLIPENVLNQYVQQGISMEIFMNLVNDVAPYIRLGENKVNSSNPMITIDGKTQTLKQWSLESGFTYSTLLRRLKNGVKPEELLLPAEQIKGERKVDPKIALKLLTVNGTKKKIGEWAEEVGVHPHVIHKRLKKGWKPHEAILPTGTKIKEYRKKELCNIKTVSINGQIKTIEEWSKESGIPALAILNRMEKGWKTYELLMPVGMKKEQYIEELIFQNQMLSIHGVEKTYKEWAEQSGLSITKIKRRKELGWTDDELLSPPNTTKNIEKNLTVLLDNKVKTVKQLARMAGVKPETIAQRIGEGKTGWEIVFPKNPTYMTIGTKTYLIKEWMELLQLSDKETYYLYQKYKKGLDEETIEWVTKKMEENKIVTPIRRNRRNSKTAK